MRCEAEPLDLRYGAELRNEFGRSWPGQVIFEYDKIPDYNGFRGGP